MTGRAYFLYIMCEVYENRCNILSLLTVLTRNVFGYRLASGVKGFGSLCCSGRAHERASCNASIVSGKVSVDGVHAKLA